MNIELKLKNENLVKLVIQLKRSSYTGGQYIQGSVYLNCKSTINCQKLILSFRGEQSISWTEQSQAKNLKSNLIQKKNFKKAQLGQFELTTFFKGIIMGGCYSFPFQFLLPQQLGGSMQQDSKNYKKYFLSAILLRKDENYSHQSVQKQIIIKQSIEKYHKTTKAQHQLSAQSCGGLMLCGMFKVGIKCQKSFVQMGQKVVFTGYINNDYGNGRISQFSVNLIGKMNKRQSHMASKQFHFSNQLIYADYISVDIGQNKQFDFQVTIPEVKYPTSIGSIILAYYVLQFTFDMNCCASNAKCQLHIVIHGKSQQIYMSQDMIRIEEQQFIVADQVICNNMKPYVSCRNNQKEFQQNQANNLTKMDKMKTVTIGQIEENIQNNQKMKIEEQNNELGTYELDSFQNL